MEMSLRKSEKMAFLGQDRVKCNIMVDKKCLKQEKNFKYLGCGTSYGKEKRYLTNN